MLIALVCCAIWLAWQTNTAGAECVAFAESPNEFSIERDTCVTCGEQWTGVRQPRCKQLDYFLTIYTLDVFCGRDTSGATKRCSKSALKQKCGSEEGCKFELLMLPFGSLRKGPSYWNIYDSKMAMQFERTPNSAVGKKAKAGEKVPVFRVKEMNPTTPHDCGVLALAAKEAKLGLVNITGSNVGHFDGMVKYHLPIPCPYQNEQSHLLHLHKKSILMDTDIALAGGEKVQLQIQMVTSFVWRKFMNDTTRCLYMRKSLIQPGDIPKIHCLRDIPGRDRVDSYAWVSFKSFFYSLLLVNKPWRGVVDPEPIPDMQEPDIPEFPNTRCQRASYLYGVVQAKVACHAECLRLGGGKCYTLEANALCDDPDDNIGCDFLVDTDRRGAAKDSSKDQIRLQFGTNSAISHNKEQHLFLALDKDSPKSKMCDRLRATVLEYDCKVNTRLAGPILLDVPYPSEADGIVVKEYTLNTSFECTGSQQSFPKYPIHINLTMIFVPLWTVTSQGLLECADLSSIHPSLFKCKRDDAEQSTLKPNNKPFANKVKELVKTATGKSLRKVCYSTKPNNNAGFHGNRACITV